MSPTRVTHGRKRSTAILATIMLATTAIAAAVAGGAQAAAPATSRLSTAANATVPQGSVSLPPFALPAKGTCGDAPIVLDVQGQDRMTIEVAIMTVDGNWIGEVVLGRGDAQRFPRQAIQVCRKAVDDGVIATVPVRPSTDYVLTLHVQVGGRKGPTYTDTDSFTTGR